MRTSRRPHDSAPGAVDQSDDAQSASQPAPRSAPPFGSQSAPQPIRNSSRPAQGPTEPRSGLNFISPVVSPDRRTVSTQRIWLLTLIVGLQLWAALSSITASTTPSGQRPPIAEAAALCSVLAMFGLRSLPIRWIARGLTLLSGLLIGRFGELGATDGLVGSWRVLLWLVTTALALGLAPSSRSIPGAESSAAISADAVPPVDSSAARRAGGAVEPSKSSSVATFLVVLTASTSLVCAAALLAGPRIANGFPTGSSAGDRFDLTDNVQGNALAARDRLDMTTRPRLSDEVVLTVRSEFVSFWRTETFDVWDGSAWTRSNPGEGRFVNDGQVQPGEFDVAATDGAPSEQQFRLESRFATSMPVAPSAVSVDAAWDVAQRPDSSLVVANRPLGKGATYSVTSRRVPTTAEQLRSASSDAVPAAVRERYAAPPVATPRVAELASTITATADNDFDRIRAIEAWMGDNTEYSLDAPLSPIGVDVVDDFLFDSQLGWCEQIASSLVVMARLAGVPARLATGFTPGQWDSVAGRFVVRERNAHAWAEVWFDDVGWVPFDPTADVPLAGNEDATAGAGASDWRENVGLALLAFGVVLLALRPVRRLVGRIAAGFRERRRERRRVRASWDAATERRLETFGAAQGRPRRDGETSTAYAAALSRLLDRERLAEVGAVLDRRRYGPTGAAESPDDVENVEEILSSSAPSASASPSASDGRKSTVGGRH